MSDPSQADTVWDAWDRTLNSWNSRMFTDSPQAKSIFAFGAAYVLNRLDGDLTPERWEEVRQEFVEFSASYMAKSR